MKTLRKQANSKRNVEYQLRLTKEKWLDKMRAKKIKLQKIVLKEKSIKDNRLFEKSEGRFYRGVGSSVEHTRTGPGMDKFTDFWGGIWEDDEKNAYQPWMIEVKQKIKQKMENVREFIVSKDNIARVMKKRKNWTAPEIDDLENFWWKIFKVCWRPLSKVINQ